MSLLPESEKPIDLDLNRITCEEDCDIVLKWLDELITDMQHQVIQHLTNPQLDLQWLAKVRSALRGTIRTRARVAERRKAFRLGTEKAALDLFIERIRPLVDPQDLAQVWIDVEKALKGEDG